MTTTPDDLVTDSDRETLAHIGREQAEKLASIGDGTPAVVEVEAEEPVEAPDHEVAEAQAAAQAEADRAALGHLGIE